MVKKILQKYMALSVMLCFIFSLSGCSSEIVTEHPVEINSEDMEMEENSEIKTDERILYVDDILGVQLNEWVASSEGQIEKEGDGGNTVLCFQLVPEGKDNVIECLNDAKISVLDNTTNVIPGYRKYEYAQRLEYQETYAVYELMTSDAEAKTKTIRVFIAGDSENTYLYFFG